MSAAADERPESRARVPIQLLKVSICCAPKVICSLGQSNEIVNESASHDDGGRYTLKLYHSTKSLSPDGWQQQSITLKPLNPDFPDLTISPEHAHDLRIVGEFVALL